MNERASILLPNEVIDRGTARIVVEREIGQGAMGVVFRAWRFDAPGSVVAPSGDGGAVRRLSAPPGSPTPQPELLALKVLRDRPTEDMRELFAREAEALRRLAHPNTIACRDFFELRGSLVLALEYVDGETLESIIERQRARALLARESNPLRLPCMPFLRAWYYCQQLLGGLAAVHAFGMVHRDVKPSNVLVRRDGIVKLGDFGLARIHGAASLPSMRDFAPGTGGYMSPEQVLSRPLDGRSDLYAAAIVLYEMLTGETPFPVDRNEMEVRRDQVDTPPPPIRLLLPQAPPVLDALFARALAKDPAARFSDAIAMGNAFRSALGIAESPEWLAQGDIARTAKTIADLRISMPGADAEGRGHEAKLATLREFVVNRYKTLKMPAV